MTPRVALTIAGSDPSGGAGIAADLKTFAALGVYGTCAITALTAQNTRGVTGIQVVSADFVLAQVEAVLEDLAVATPEIVSTVAGLAAAGRLPQLVVDPVMVASSGDRLLQPEAEELYVEALLPHATLLTPNVREAEVLLGTSIRTLAEQRDAAHALGELGPATVVVTGGHRVSDRSEEAVDVVWDGKSTYDLPGPRIDTVNNHGTGCTFAAAAAAALADGAQIAHALQNAKAYVSAALQGGASWQLGHGHGPLDHFTETVRWPGPS